MGYLKKTEKRRMKGGKPKNDKMHFSGQKCKESKSKDDFWKLIKSFRKESVLISYQQGGKGEVICPFPFFLNTSFKARESKERKIKFRPNGHNPCNLSCILHIIWSHKCLWMEYIWREEWTLSKTCTFISLGKELNSKKDFSFKTLDFTAEQH